MSEERRASWLELFFDVVFVASAYQLSSVINGNYTQFWIYALLFLPILWVWVGHVMFTTRYSHSGTFYTVMTIIQMICVIGMSVSLEDAYTSPQAFSVLFAIATFSIIGLYLNQWKNTETQTGFKKVIVFYAISALIWLISSFTPHVFTLWAVGLIIDVFSPVVFSRYLSKIPIHKTHLPERLGLFTIIVLGEMIISLVTGLSSIALDWYAVLVMLLGTLIVTAIALQYFYALDKFIMGKVEGSGQYHLYAHVLLYTGLILLAAGFKVLLFKQNAAPIITLSLAIFAVPYVLILTNCYHCQKRYQTGTVIIFLAVVFYLFLENLSQVSYLIAISSLLFVFIIAEQFIMQKKIHAQKENNEPRTANFLN